MDSKRTLLHQNKFFKIFKGKCHYLKYHGNNKGISGSAVLIINQEKTKILLINLYRDAISRNSWEIPRGGADDDENYEFCAKREGEEETGLTLYNLKKIGSIAPETGTMSSLNDVYFATADEREIPKKIDTDDLINETKWVALNDVLKMIKNDEILCGWTISTIMKYILLEKKL